MGDRTCTVEDCGAPHSARGFCGAHYQKWHRYGDPLTAAPERQKICDFPGCDKAHKSRGYCEAHAKQLRFGKELQPLRGFHNGAPCSVEDCTQPPVARGWCHTHYRRWRKHGDPTFVTPPRGPGIRTYTLNETYFDVIDDEKHAYWLGFISADACIYDMKNNYGFKLELAGIDEYHLYRLKDALDSDRPIRPTRRGCVRLDIDSQHMAKALVSLGVTPRKSFTLRPWNGPTELICHYWRGYFDGNGSIVDKHGRHEWSLTLTGSRHVIDAYAVWVRNITATRAMPRPAKSVWQFTVAGSRKPQLLAHALYCDSTIYLDRKHEAARKLIGVDLEAVWRHANRRRRIAQLGIPIAQRRTRRG